MGRTSRNLLPVFVAPRRFSVRKGCGDATKEGTLRLPNIVAMFTTAGGQNRTFYFPPANCLVSCCRWRARRTVGEENRPVLALGRASSLHLSEPLRWLQASPSLELCRNTKRWHLTLSVYASFFIFSTFPPPPSQAVPDTLPVPVIVCFAALAVARSRMNLDVRVIIVRGKSLKPRGAPS